VRQGEGAEAALAEYGKAKWRDVDATDRKAVVALLNGIKTGYRILSEPLDLGSLQIWLDGGNHAFGDAILQVKHRAHLAIEPVGQISAPVLR
jgi:hypothetical protein